MELRNENLIDNDKQIFTKLEHAENMDELNIQNSSSFNQQQLQFLQGDQRQNNYIKANGFNQTQRVNNTQDTTNNYSSTNASSMNYTNSHLPIHPSSKNDHTDSLFRNYEDPYHDSQSPVNNNGQNQGFNSSLNGNENGLQNTSDPNNMNHEQQQRQQQLSRSFDIATYELQPEIKGMIVSLKYIGVPNHKVVEEIGKLGFTISDSNVYMVWEEWSEERTRQGKSIFRDQNQTLKGSKGLKKSNKINRKFSGRQSSEDEDEEDDEEDEDDEERYLEQDAYQLNTGYNQKRSQQFPTGVQNISHRLDYDGSDEFDEISAPSKFNKYSQLINNKLIPQNRKNNHNDNMNNLMSDELDFDSDYDENYKKKAANDSRKQVFSNLEQHPRKQVKMHGDHVLFFNLEMGQCVYCAQNNKENEVYTTCIECEGAGQNKFYICEDCFEINHSKPSQNHKKLQQKSQVKDEVQDYEEQEEDYEQPFIDSDSSDGIVLKKIKPNEDLNSNQVKNGNSKGQIEGDKINHNQDENNQNTIQEEKQSKEYVNDILKRVETSSSQQIDHKSSISSSGQSLLERINKSQLVITSSNLSGKTQQENLDSQDTSNLSQQQQNGNKGQVQVQKKILKIFRNPQNTYQ